MVSTLENAVCGKVGAFSTPEKRTVNHGIFLQRFVYKSCFLDSVLCTGM